MLHALFGAGHFAPWKVGTLLTAPIFMARGRAPAAAAVAADTATAEAADDKPSRTPRTDVRDGSRDRGRTVTDGHTSTLFAWS